MIELPDNYRFKHTRAPWNTGVYVKLQRRVLGFIWLTVRDGIMYRGRISDEIALDYEQWIWNTHIRYQKEQEDIKDFLHEHK